MSNIITTTAETFNDDTSTGVVLLDVWAPWCGPCRMIAPTMEELSVQFKGQAKIVKLNSDDEQQKSTELGVRSIPTIIIMKDGEEVDRIMGARSHDFFARKIEEFLDTEDTENGEEPEGE